MKQPPTSKEVSAWCEEKKYPDYSAEFIDHHEMRGWRVGRFNHPMQSWKSALNIWHRNALKFRAEDERRNPRPVELTRGAYVPPEKSNEPIPEEEWSAMVDYCKLHNLPVPKRTHACESR